MTLPSLRATIPEPAESTAVAADHVIDVLVAAGVDTFFGVPGGPVMPVFDAVLRHRGARLIESRHETTALFSAMGYWTVTGRVPGVLVTAGPGGTNALTGIAAAHHEAVPVVVICGDVAWAATGGRMLQNMGPEGIDIERAVGHLTRACVRVQHASSAAAYALRVHEATDRAGGRGPGLLVLPLDTALEPVELPATISVADRRVPATEPVELTPGATAAAVALASANRPLVVVGAGCADAAEQVRLAIEALNVPFVTTPRGKGMIDEKHPLSLRHSGLAASWWARRYTAESVDVTLALGTDLDDCSIGPTPLVGPGGRLIHVDLDPLVFARNLPTTAGVVADVGAFAGRLREVATRHEWRHPYGAELVEAVARSSPYDRPDFATDPARPVAPHRVLHDLARSVGDDARFVTDIGEHMLFALHYLTARDRLAFGIHLGLGSMGSGIGSAIGRALGDRSRRVVCVCGDGGMQMCGAEILVAVEHRLPVLFAVFNDARYNMVYHGYRQQFGRSAPWATPPIDFVAWAGAYGVPARRITAPGEITAELVDELMRSAGPALLDIRHDPDVRIEGAGRVEALQRMSLPRHRKECTVDEICARNKKTVRRWIDVSNAKDLDGLDELFTVDTVDHAGNGVGIEHWKAMYRAINASFPDWHATAEHIVAEGDLVVVHGAGTGTHRGAEVPFLSGIEPTGRRVTMSVHHTFRLVNGRIAEHWANRDDLGMLRALGVI